MYVSYLQLRGGIFINSIIVYRVVGCMLNDPHPHESIGFDWGSVYCGHEDDPCAAPDFPEPNFDLMFFMDIPFNTSKKNTAKKGTL